MRYLLLTLFSFNLFAQLDVKISLIENPFSLPSNVEGLQVQNIAKGTESLELNYTKKLKKREALSFSFINKLNFEGMFFNTDLDSNKEKYNLKNRDSVNENLKNISMSISSLAYKKVAKKSVLFISSELKYSDGYNLDYDLRAMNFKEYDYFLSSSENVTLSTGFGMQSKLTSKIRLDTNYTFKIEDYFFDYSIYDINKGQEEDNISHSILANLNYSFNKIFNIDLKSFANYKIYKNKLALKENGYIVVEGLALAEELLDASQTVGFNINVAKGLSLNLDLGKFIRSDQVSGARDVSIESYKLAFNYSSKVSFNGSYEYKRLNYDNQIASLIDETDLEGLRSNSRELKLGVIYSDFALNITNINTNSTRVYDTINHNRFDLSYGIKI